MRETPDQVADRLSKIEPSTEQSNTEQSALALAKEALWRWLYAPRNRRERRNQMFGGHGRKARMTPLSRAEKRAIARSRRIAAACGDYSLA